MNRHPSEYLGDGGSADGTLVLRTVEEPMRRRRFLGGSMASLGIAGALGATAPHAPADRRPEYPPRGLGQTLGFDLTWLGVNGWWIVFDGVTVLVDPWVTRFVTGTFGGLTPVRRIDTAELPAPYPGPVTRRLQALYAAAVEEDVTR